MKRIPTRQRLLGGALLAAGAIWGVDRLTGSSAPTPAQAQPGDAGAQVAGPVVWQDVDELLTRLTTVSYSSVAEELDRVERDLFLPTDEVDAAYETVAAVEEAAGTEPPVDVAAEFRERHRLVGVMLGHLALATVDDQVLPLGAELEGCRLVEIRRDQVVFLEPGTRVRIVLQLESRPRISSAGGP